MASGTDVPFFYLSFIINKLGAKSLPEKKLVTLVTKFSNFAHFRCTILTVCPDKARCRKTGDCLSALAIYFGSGYCKVHLPACVSGLRQQTPKYTY
jgi:hypothetical protein